MKYNTTLNNMDSPIDELGDRQNNFDRIKNKGLALKKYVSLILMLIAPIIWFVYTFNIANSWNDPDTFWHIRIGQQILAEGKIPTIAINTFQDNLQYIPHEGGFQILISLLFNAAGWNGLNAFTLTCLMFLMIGLYRLSAVTTGKVWYRLHPLIHLIIIFSSKFVFDYYFSNRPQVISTVCILWFFIFLNKLHHSQKATNLIPIASLALVVSNFHSGVYPVILAFWFVFVADQVLTKKTYKVGHYVRIFLFSFFLVACMFINFGGLAASSYITTATKNNFQSYITEWAPVNFYEKRTFALMLLLYIWSMAFNTNKNLLRLLFSTGIVILAIWSYKTFIFLPVFVIFEFSGAIQKLNFKNTLNINKRMYQLLFLAFGVSVVIKTAFIPYGLPAKLFPADELHYIQENTKASTEKPKVLADYAVSGYLNFNNVKVLADGRFDPFTVEQSKDANGKTAFERSILFTRQMDTSVIQYDDPDYIIIRKMHAPARMLNEDTDRKAIEKLGKPDFEGRYGMVWGRKIGGWDYVSKKQ